MFYHERIIVSFLSELVILLYMVLVVAVEHGAKRGAGDEAEGDGSDGEERRIIYEKVESRRRETEDGEEHDEQDEHRATLRAYGFLSFDGKYLWRGFGE